MVDNFYTNVTQYKGKILVRGYYNGERYSEKVNYKPFLFVESRDGNGEFQDYKREKKLKKLDFDSIRDARDFIEKYSNVSNFKLYGMDNFVYTYINDEFKNIKYDSKKISVVGIDIEVASDQGMPNVDLADKEITLITLGKNNVYYTLGCDNFLSSEENHKYLRCKNEIDLLDKFLALWKALDPDVVTGWYSELFDIPYVYNRIVRLLGEDRANSLSPWGVVNEREINQKYGKGKIKQILGIAQLDYMVLYKKFSYTPQENYRLNTIATHELNLGKVDFSGSLFDLYKTDFPKFVRYNKRDVELVFGIDDKLKFIDLVFAIAYDSKVNFIDAVGTVLLWDVIIHNYLLKKKIAVPFQIKKDDGGSQFPQGGYVKEPILGYHEWIGSWDYDSLYPHLAILLNISPDTFIGMEGNISPDVLLNDGFVWNKKEYTIAGNGAMFRKDFQGFFSDLMQTMYKNRAKFKKQMIEAKKLYEKEPTFENQKKVAALNARQNAEKIKLNSAYGALANAFFRWFDFRLAEAITLSGQFSIRYVEKQVNVFLNGYFKTDGVDYVIASDTDSIYIRFGKKENVIEDILNVKISNWSEEIYKKLNAHQNVLKMKRESIALSGIWTGKKHYALNVIDMEGVVYDKPKVKITGLEVVKSSTPSAVKADMKKAIEIIFNGTNEELIELVQKSKKTFKTKSFEDIAFPRSVNDLKKYYDNVTLWSKGTPIQVKGSLVYNDFVKKKNWNLPIIHDSDKIKFAYLLKPNPVKSEVIATPNELPKVFGLDDYIDYDTQFEKAFIKPVKEIAHQRGWELEKRDTLF